MRRVLVLGGYGGFGARLSRRLAGEGWQVIVAGRSIDKARALAETLPLAEAARMDRDGDLAAAVQEHAPDLLVDAAGPFQGSDYRVPRACIHAGVAYLDLADAREFVCGIGTLDAEARAAGVPVIAGASSVPALSGAVVEELARGLQRVTLVEMSIAASARTTGGTSVGKAVLSYAGAPMRLWRGRRWTLATGLSELQRETYRVPGQRVLRRSVALADVPDHDLLPRRIAGQPSAVFRAGTDSHWQMWLLARMSGLVRRGWLPPLTRLADVLLPVQRLLGRFASRDTAMRVDVKGHTGTGWRRRSWTVFAGKAHGGEIPVMAAQIIAGRLREGSLPPGARDAGEVLALSDFTSLFAELDIETHLFDEPYEPPYARVMGVRFASLPEPVRAMHDIAGDHGAVGSGVVRRGSGLLARLAAFVMQMPPAGEYPLHVGFTEHGGVERWTRSFGPHRFHSELSATGSLLTERFGPLRFRFDLPSDHTGLRMAFRGWSFLGIPLPRFLGPRIVASETVEDGRFRFEVDVALPLAGPVVHYHGTLEPQAD